MNVHKIPCEQCGTLTPSYDLVTTGPIATGYQVDFDAKGHDE